MGGTIAHGRRRGTWPKFGGRALAKLIGCLFMGVAFGTTALWADVFSRTVAGDDIPAFLAQLGGKTAYKASVRINGESARLRVIGFNDADKALRSQIRRSLKLKTPRSHTNTDGLYTLVGSDQVTRLLLVQTGTLDQMLAIVIEQSRKAFRRRRTAPPNPEQVLPLPIYPGSQSTLLAANEDTGVVFGSLTANAAPEQVNAFYRAKLASAGWEPMFPASGASGSGLFLRRDAVCFALATRTKHGCQISLLHKSLKNPTP